MMNKVKVADLLEACRTKRRMSWGDNAERMTVQRRAPEASLYTRRCSELPPPAFPTRNHPSVVL